MRATTSAPTLKVTTARLEFSSDRRLAKALHFAAVAALIFLVVAIGRHLHADSQAPGAVLAGLKQQNATLRADLARARIELELERSTHAALARQVAELNDETSQLKSRLEFFNSQGGRTGKTR